MVPNCPSLDEWHRNVPTSSAPAIAGGTAVLLVCILGFGTWAAVAPLEGAVVAHGSFVATGENKQVQHLEGGIIEKVFVKEGEVVEAGQVLVQMEDTAAATKLRRLQLRANRLAITRLSLEAAILGAVHFDAPVETLAADNDPEIAGMLRRQRAELAANRAKLEAEEEVYRREIAGLEQSVTGFRSQFEATERRLKLFKEELDVKNQLLLSSLARKTDVLSLQRAEATLFGELGQLTGRIADAQERIARANQQIVSLRSTANQRSVEELRKVESELDDTQEQIRAAEDILRRTKVRAPTRGVIIKINNKSRDSIVRPSDALLELLPLNDELVIEARVKPSDMTEVRTGQAALVRLAALKQRTTPMVAANVVYVSADVVSDTQGGQGSQPRRDSFLVRVKLDPADKFLATGQFEATPGMPADVYIKTEARTFMDYVMSPVYDSFSRAFRER